MKLWKYLLVAVAFTLTACDEKIETKDGNIPTEYLPYVQEFLGHYRGQFNRVANEAHLELNGQALKLQFQQDLINNVCESRVGKLLNFSYSKKDDKITVTGAQFAFDANLCSTDVEGTVLYVTFKDGGINLSLLERVEYDRHCRPPYYPSPAPPYGPGPGFECRVEPHARYLNGRLLK